MSRDRTIILDCDGVLLNWRYPFEQWIKNIGVIPKEYHWDPANYDANDIPDVRRYMRVFNQTYHIERLPAIDGAVSGVKLLLKQGYRIKVCTSFSTDHHSINMRVRNLKKLFGDVFSDFKALDIGGSKEDYLKQHYEEDIIFFDDAVTNIEAAKRAGYSNENVILFPYLYNLDYGIANPDVPRWDWPKLIKEFSA